MAGALWTYYLRIANYENFTLGTSIEYLTMIIIGGLGSVLGSVLGAIFIKLNRLDGTAELFGPAPQSIFDEAHPSDRAFTRFLGKEPVPEELVEDRLKREIRFDSDAWILEVEDRAGRHFLDRVVA